MLLAAGLIVFRETLEAALFVGIVAAATAHLAGRARWLVFGIMGGVAGSLALAASMNAITAMADGIGQDLLTAVLLGLALLMLGWHVIQAPAHARQASRDAKRLGAAATSAASTRDSRQSIYALSIAVALAVAREGAEMVLFIAGATSGRDISAVALMMSIAGGFALGGAAGWALYYGLGRIGPKQLLRVANGLILLLAGGIASQLTHTLSQANWLSVLGERAWDLSAWLPNNSLIGTLLQGLVGYDANPSQMQLLSYAATVVTIVMVARWVNARPRNPGAGLGAGAVPPG